MAAITCADRQSLLQEFQQIVEKKKTKPAKIKSQNPFKLVSPLVHRIKNYNREYLLAKQYKSTIRNTLTNLGRNVLSSSGNQEIV